MDSHFGSFLFIGTFKVEIDTILVDGSPIGRVVDNGGKGERLYRDVLLLYIDYE